MGEQKNKVIMVNSFKGGAGKTTLALGYCVNAFRHGSDYDNIYYIDIDVLGTSIAYTLLPDNCNVVYFNKDNNDDFSENVNRVLSEGKKTFYAALLTPDSRKPNEYFGREKFRHYPEVIQSIFKDRINEFLKWVFKQSDNNLVVFDCSPGLANLELNILNDCYNFKINNICDVEEVYVTTLDSSHITKTVENLIEMADYLHKDSRKITIVLNDIFGCEKIAKNNSEAEGNTFVFNKKSIVERISQKLKDLPCSILFHKYSEKILENATIGNEKKLVNDIDSYDLDIHFFDEQKVEGE